MHFRTSICRRSPSSLPACILLGLIGFAALASGSLASAQCPAWVADSAPSGSGFSLPSTVHSLAQGDLGAGAGPQVFALDNTQTLRAWNGTSWTAVPGAPAGIHMLEVGSFGAGSLQRLFAVGTHTLAMWDGLAWTTIPGIAYPGITALALLDDGSGNGNALYVGGDFELPPLPLAWRVARWDGASWTTLGETDELIGALAIHDDGGGPMLYCAGRFNSVDGVPTGVVARRNGSIWQAVGSPALVGYANALIVHDDGHGSALYVGGSSLGNLHQVLRWNGAQWGPVGLSLDNGEVLSFATFDDGGGDALYATGRFARAGTLVVNSIARWNGTAWSGLASGLIFGTAPTQVLGSGYSLVASADRASGAPELVVSGSFTTSGGLPATNVARWRGCSFDVVCAADGSDPSLVACPCGNSGAAGRGCGNSIYSAGARLTANGAPVVSADTLTLSASDVSGGVALFFQGDALDSHGVVLGDGVRCVGGSIVRLGTRAASGSIATIGFAGGTSIAGAGAVPAAGGVEFYQAWYRNSASYCTPTTFNETNAVRVLWVP